MSTKCDVSKEMRNLKFERRFAEVIGKVGWLLLTAALILLIAKSDFGLKTDAKILLSIGVAAVNAFLFFVPINLMDGDIAGNYRRELIIRKYCVDFEVIFAHLSRLASGAWLANLELNDAERALACADSGDGENLAQLKVVEKKETFLRVVGCFRELRDAAIGLGYKDLKPDASFKDFVPAALKDASKPAA